ncbi:MAG: flagellar filament capping protein FliD [Azoarcus sp.]|nr:flagellar filament capping protein FliD [Azoarcus sp.]
MDIDLAVFRLNALSTLVAGGGAGGQGNSGNTDFLSTLLNSQNALAGAATGGAAQGLLGGESARATSVLAQLESSNASFLRHYNARVSEIGDEAQVLTQLRARVAELGAASQGLASLNPSSADADIKSALQSFVTRYNAWDAEFDPYFERGGTLEGSRAGEIVRFSLRREVGSIFHGAGNGGFEQGLTDMGVQVTPDGQLKLDEAAFDAALGANRTAAVQTLNNVATAFGDAAEMLASDGHLLDRRIDNAASAVNWAASYQDTLEAEFGPGAISNRLR